MALNAYCQTNSSIFDSSAILAIPRIYITWRKVARISSICEDARLLMSLSKAQLSRAYGVLIGKAAGDGAPLLPTNLLPHSLIASFDSSRCWI